MEFVLPLAHTPNRQKKVSLKTDYLGCGRHILPTLGVVWTFYSLCFAPGHRSNLLKHTTGFTLISSEDRRCFWHGSLKDILISTLWTLSFPGDAGGYWPHSLLPLKFMFVLGIAFSCEQHQVGMTGRDGGMQASHHHGGVLVWSPNRRTVSVDMPAPAKRLALL